MHNDTTNLLPIERQRSLSRDYVLHLITVAATLLTLLVLVAGAMLLPTYIFLTRSESAKETRLTTIRSSFSSADEKELSGRLTALTKNLTILTELKKAPSVSKIMRDSLAVSHPGITLSNFAYTPAGRRGPATLGITGTAATRDALRTYQLALQGAPFALAATLPVSVYAQDTNINFVITVSLAP